MNGVLYTLWLVFLAIACFKVRLPERLVQRVPRDVGLCLLGVGSFVLFWASFLLERLFS
jgi:hypothetical protein